MEVRMGKCPVCMGKGSYPVARLLVNGTLVENVKVGCTNCAGSGRYPMPPASLPWKDVKK